MAFADLATNQGVSFTNAQTGGFTLKPSQSSVTSNEQMTKLDATTKYYLDISNIYLSPKPNNQVVAKRDLTSGNYCQSIGAGSGCFNWNITAGPSGAVVQVINCSGANTSVVLGANGTGNLCACDQVTPTVTSGSATVTQVGSCIGTTTTTTSTSTSTSTTTSTTTASPTTTTSTTTLALGECCTVQNTQGAPIGVQFYNTSNVLTCNYVDTGETAILCIYAGTGPSVYPWTNTNCTGALASAVISVPATNCVDAGSCI